MPYLNIDGADLYHEVVGSGEPVLLLHGGFCSLESLRPQSDALADDHTVYAFERPGHGRSADIDGEYGYARGVAETVAYLRAVGLQSVHIIGYSDGAIIGLLLAIQHPHLVRSLVAISANLDPSAFTGSTQSAPALVLDRVTPGADVGEPSAERRFYDSLSPDGPDHAQVVLDKLFRLWTAEPRIDRAELAHIGVPTLVMSADRDTIRPDHSLLIAASIPGAQLCIVPGASHNLVGERPELIASVIGDFLMQLRPKQAGAVSGPPAEVRSGRGEAGERVVDRGVGQTEPGLEE